MNMVPTRCHAPTHMRHFAAYSCSKIYRKARTIISHANQLRIFWVMMILLFLTASSVSLSKLDIDSGNNDNHNQLEKEISKPTTIHYSGADYSHIHVMDSKTKSTTSGWNTTTTPSKSNHPPLLPHQPPKTDRDPVNNEETKQSTIITVGDNVPPKLRFDWTNLVPQSKLANDIWNHQGNCSLPLGNAIFRNEYGLGSDLHFWTRAICHGMQHKVRVRTLFPWLWMDQAACGTTTNETSAVASPMHCYFPKSELLCPGDVELVPSHPSFDGTLWNITRTDGEFEGACQSVLRAINSGVVTKSQFQAAGMEFLFSSVAPLVLEEAERQYSLVFEGKPAPNDLITVHIRWGDKKREMSLIPINQYVRAIQKLLKERGTDPNNGMANIFLASEDPKAVWEFQQAVPNRWKVYVDQFYHETKDFRTEEYNGIPKMAALLQGRTGTVALASLLVAMEANDFVLTLGSNWSRLMNELRKTILDPRCNSCTKMIDLRRQRQEVW